MSNNFIVDSNSKIFLKILWYINTYLKNTNIDLLYANFSKNRRLEHTDNQNFICFSQNFDFIFENISFNLVIKEIDTVKENSCRGILEKLHKLIIKYDKNLNNEIIKNDNEIQFIIKNLISKSIKEYEKNNKFIINNDKISLFINEGGWWEDFTEISKREIDTIILNQDLKNKIINCINDYKNPDYVAKLESLGIKNKLNILLEGLPGTGKSSLINAIASMLNKNIAFFDLNQPEFTDSKFIKSIVKLPDNCICVFEDFDSIFNKRDKTENTNISFSCILNFLDGMYSKKDLLIILTTNHKENIDPAILRPMRIDHIFNFTFASKYQCEQMYFKMFSDKNIENFNKIFNLIKNDKFTTSMLQKWFLLFINNENKLIENYKIFKELINLSNTKEYNMFM